MKKGYTTEPLSFNRKMVAASAAITARRSTVHSMAEVDITEPRRLIREHDKSTGEKLSFTAYIVHGKPTPGEFLCLTVSFDHDIVDGAPAARFMSHFLETLKSGIYLQKRTS